jgi:hypothetical protein
MGHGATSSSARRQLIHTCSGFFSLSFILALPIDSPNHPALVGDAQRTEKNPRNNFFYCRSKFELHRLLAQSASLRQYIWAGIPSFHSLVIITYISLSSFSQLSPYLYIFLPISISLAISFFFAISICLSYTENQNNSKQGCTVCCVLPYLWGHRLKIVLYLAEPEID